ncbi:LysR family transcriptional regulator [Corallococcus exercitus]|uniref:LysR family transcriptional regulator n=1 Tax=Corallococcus exercitus TaxID=2316736 RepID=A0A7Y4KFX8_9BACT|nr:LysR family transcriptional regulator [Corallococcus exercitus]NOK32907.1 LysR family transcriptional regulator [Corallococcus exercitus]
MPGITNGYGSLAGMDLNALHYFRAIASTGSLTAAARLLRVSQPALSVAVRKLEQRFGTSLLQRGPRGVLLTRTGEELARHADEMLLLAQRTAETIQGLESGDAGRFVVGCYHSFGAFFLPGFIRKLHADTPGIDVSLWEGTADEVRNAVVDRKVHFGVAVSPRPHPDLVLVKLFRDVMGVFASRELLRAHRGGPRALVKKGPLLSVERIFLSRKVVEALGAGGMLPERLMSCGDLELVKSLALNGVGPAILPARVAAYNLPKGALRLVSPTLPHELDEAYLFYRVDLHRTRAALRVKDALVARGRELDGALKLPNGVPTVAAHPGNLR